MTASGDLMTLARLAGGLVVVLTLIYLSARIAKRGRLRRGESGVRVLDRIGLSRDAHLAVVEIGGRTVLLGVTSQSVHMLTTMDGEELPTTETPAEPVAAPPVAPVVRTIALPEVIPDDEPGELVDQIGADRVRPATEQPSPSARPDPVPSGVTLDGYPDLASALRAAGRTASAPQERMPVGPPRTRAEARRREQALAEAAKALEEAEAAQIAARAARQAREAQAKVPQQRTPVKRTTARPPVQQASGSVLSPKTWQQGIDALREYTVRRG